MQWRTKTFAYFLIFLSTLFAPIVFVTVDLEYWALKFSDVGLRWVEHSVPAAVGAVCLLLSSWVLDCPKTVQVIIVAFVWVLIVTGVFAMIDKWKRYDVNALILLFTGLLISWSCRKFFPKTTLSESAFFSALSKSSVIAALTFFIEAALMFRGHSFFTSTGVGALLGVAFNFTIAALAHFNAAIMHLERDIMPALRGCIFCLALGPLTLVIGVNYFSVEESIGKYLKQYAVLLCLLAAASMFRVRRIISSPQFWGQAIPGWIQGLLESDLLRACGLIICLPGLPIFMFIFGLRNRARSCRGNLAQVESPWPDWDTTTLFRNATSMLLFYVVMVVSAKNVMNNILLLLEYYVGGLSVFWLCVMLVISGLILFIAPFTSGVPIYVLGGRLLVRHYYMDKLEEEALSGDYHPQISDPGFLHGFLIAAILGSILKLAACALQQGWIGASMGSSLRIRMMVGIHTVPTRATEAILRGSAVFPKVCILLGGPDWPTSVLCGILHLSLWRILLQTTPVILQSVGPSALFGSASYVIQDAGTRLTAICGDPSTCQPGNNTMADQYTDVIATWTGYGQVSLVIAVCGQLVLAVFAVNYVQTEAADPKHAEPREEDAPLLRQAALEAERNERLAEYLNWEVLPLWIRLCYIISTVGLWIKAVPSALGVNYEEIENGMILHHIVQGVFILGLLFSCVPLFHKGMLERSWENENPGRLLSDVELSQR